MTSKMSLVRCRDAGEEGLVFLFEQVLLLAGPMWVFLCLAPILNSVFKKTNNFLKNTLTVDTSPEITSPGLFHAGKLKGSWIAADSGSQKKAMCTRT